MTESNDHKTIEQRLSLLEHAVRVHGVQIEVLNGYLSDTIHTDSGMDQDILDLDERVSKLEDAAKGMIDD
jgi:hypothetical protein